MSSAAGTLAEGIHRFPVRVYYEDTDAAGVVFYANYLKYTERARTDLLRIMGIEQSRLAERDSLIFVVSRCAADFLRSARLDDDLEVRTRVLAVKAATVEAEQTVWRDDEELVRMNVRIACVRRGGAGRPARIPGEIRALFQPLCGAH